MYSPAARRRGAPWGWIVGLAVVVALFFLGRGLFSGGPTATSPTQPGPVASGSLGASPDAALAVLDAALSLAQSGQADAATVQQLVNLLEGPEGAAYDGSVTAPGDDGVGLIPRLEELAAQPVAAEAAGGGTGAADLLEQARATDLALTSALTGEGADLAGLLEEQAVALEDIRAALAGSNAAAP